MCFEKGQVPAHFRAGPGFLLNGRRGCGWSRWSGGGGLLPRDFVNGDRLSETLGDDRILRHALTRKVRIVALQAAESLATVNLYLSVIADTVKKHDGTLDKFMGDCVMAFWGAPTPNEQHALHCVRAAIEAQRAVYALNQERFAENERRKKENEALAAEGRPPRPLLPLLTLGSGINTGYAVVGLMGSDTTILNYTVFGREVNLASRLEGASGRGRIFIGESTYLDLKRDDPDLGAHPERAACAPLRSRRH